MKHPVGSPLWGRGRRDVSRLVSARRVTAASAGTSAHRWAVRRSEAEFNGRVTPSHGAEHRWRSPPSGR